MREGSGHLNNFIYSKGFTSLLVVELWISLTQAFHLLLKIKSIKSVSSCWTRNFESEGVVDGQLLGGNIYLLGISLFYIYIHIHLVHSLE